MGPVARIVGIVLAAAVASFAPRADPCAPAPAEEARAGVVQRRLATTAEGTRLGRSPVAAPRVCFGDGEGGLVAGRTAVLERGATVDAQAARLGHLWQHAEDGAPRLAPGPGEACEAWLAEALCAETRGDAVEARIARGLGVVLRPVDASARDRAYAERCGEAGRAALTRRAACTLP